MTATYDLTFVQGETYDEAFLWAAAPYLYRPITRILRQAPVRIQCPAHGLPDGWPVAIVSVQGMVQINAKHNPPLPIEYREATVIDADTLELNEVNAADFYDYKSGGYVQCWTPVDLAPYTSARMTVRDKVGGAVLLDLSSDDGQLAFDPVRHAVRIKLTAAETGALTFVKGVYDLELTIDGVTPIVTRLLEGKIAVSQNCTLDAVLLP